MDGSGLKQLRVESKLTQENLSEKSGIDQTRISRLERGLYTPSQEEVEAFIRVFSQAPGKSNSLRVLRAMCNLTQYEVAQKTGIHPLRISLAERGQAELTAREMKRISRVLINNTMKGGEHSMLDGTVNEIKRRLAEISGLKGEERRKAFDEVYHYALSQRVRARDFDKLIASIGWKENE